MNEVHVQHMHTPAEIILRMKKISYKGEMTTTNFDIEKNPRTN